MLVGLPGFEPESIEPKSTSLDQVLYDDLICEILFAFNFVEDL